MNKPMAIIVVVALTSALALGGIALAQADKDPAGGAVAQEGYDLSWWTADGGGHTFSTGGDYSLGGTIGQPDAGLLTGAGYNLSGGFWFGGAGPYRVYLPVVMRNY